MTHRVGNQAGHMSQNRPTKPKYKLDEISQEWEKNLALLRSDLLIVLFVTEQLVTIKRNGWSESSGIGDQLERNRQLYKQFPHAIFNNVLFEEYAYDCKETKFIFFHMLMDTCYKPITQFWYTDVDWRFPSVCPSNRLLHSLVPSTAGTRTFYRYAF